MAARAGVSIGTVDRIVHNRGRFSPETAQRVKAVMKELDYRPNVLASRLSKPRRCRLAVILPQAQQDSGYWSLPLRGVERAHKALEGLGLQAKTYAYDRFDAADFRRAAEMVLKDKPDGVLLAPMIPQEAQIFLAQLGEDVPVVFIDTDLDGISPLAYIGQDSYQSGRLAARLMGLLCRGLPGRLLVLAPEARNRHLDNRLAGFRDFAAGEVAVIRSSVESDHDQDVLAKLLDDAFQEDVAGIFVTDASAHFVAEYLVSKSDGEESIQGRSGNHGLSMNECGGQSGANQQIPLVGYDLVPPNRQWMEQGRIDFLLTQRPEDQGYAGVNRLFRRIFFQESGPRVEHTPIDIVTPENLAYFPHTSYQVE